MSGALDRRRALVVGGGSGIGRAVVDAFVREGARVGVLELDRAKCDALRAEQPGAVVCAGDAASWDDVDTAVAATVGAFGGLDVVVTCVGLFDFYRGLASLSRHELDAGLAEAVRANVRTTLVPVHAAHDALRASRGCVVVTVSTSGFAPGRGGILYVATKFALRGAVESLAYELAPDVRVNGVAPGGTLATDLRGLRALGLHDERLDDALGRADDLAARTPLHVALTAHDHAASYVFLASDAARGMTGRFLHPDGGMPARR